MQIENKIFAVFFFQLKLFSRGNFCLYSLKHLTIFIFILFMRKINFYLKFQVKSYLYLISTAVFKKKLFNLHFFYIFSFKFLTNFKTKNANLFFFASVKEKERIRNIKM